MLRKRKLGQQIRTDGPQAHLGKSGTPTMGGIVIIIASLIGYLLGHWLTGDPMTASGLLVLFLMTGLGLVGFIDDFIKLFMRRSLGLRSGAKLLGQAVGRRDLRDPRAALPRRVRPHAGVDAPLVPDRLRRSRSARVLFVVWVIVMVTGTSNGVNLTDGLDGLASGAADPGARPRT